VTELKVKLCQLASINSGDDLGDALGLRESEKGGEGGLNKNARLFVKHLFH
jgi:hypothetical protein